MVKNIFSDQKPSILIKILPLILLVFSMSGCGEPDKPKKQSSTVNIKNLKQSMKNTLSDTKHIPKKITKSNLKDRPTHNITPNRFPDGPILVRIEGSEEAREERRRQNQKIYNLSAFTGVQRDARVFSLTEGIQPLTIKKGKESFCPADSYLSRAKPPCKEKLWLETEREHCGAKEYKLKTSPNCPGSYVKDDYWTIWTSF